MSMRSERTTDPEISVMGNNDNKNGGGATPPPGGKQPASTSQMMAAGSTGMTTGTGQQGQQGIVPLLAGVRTVFYGCNGIVASVVNKRKVKLWASDPAEASIMFAENKTFAVDLAKCPSKLTAAQYLQVQVDDGVYAPADKGTGSTSIGPRFPAQYEGAYLGAVYISDVYRDTLATQGVSLPNPPPGAEGAYGYEYQVAWYWAGVDPRAGRRYFGHHANVISRDGTKAQVDIQPAGTTLPVKPVRMWLDLASVDDCDAGPLDDGLTEITTATSGALFLGSDPFAAMRALDYPKLPRWSGH
jgi:hypothetical protein